MELQTTVIQTKVPVRIVSEMQTLVESGQFQSLDEIMLGALRRYFLDVCWKHIEQAEQKVSIYEQRYGTDYDTFNQGITTDERFLEKTNQDYPMWEADAIEWFYRLEEAQAWRKRSKTILHESWPLLMQN